MRLSAAYSYYRTRILAIEDDPAVLAPLGVTLFAHQARSDLTRGLPRDRLGLTDDWTRGRFTLLTRLTRFGSYVEASMTASGDRRFGVRWVADLGACYDIGDHVTFSVGANNLFVAYSEENGIVAYDGARRYGNFAPFGLSGGFYYGRLSVRI